MISLRYFLPISANTSPLGVECTKVIWETDEHRRTNKKDFFSCARPWPSLGFTTDFVSSHHCFKTSLSQRTITLILKTWATWNYKSNFKPWLYTLLNLPDENKVHDNPKTLALQSIYFNTCRLVSMYILRLVDWNWFRYRGINGLFLFPWHEKIQ